MNAATAQLLDVPLDDIRPHPDNPRRNLGDLAELAASIRAQGVLEPLLVEPYEGRGKGGHTYQLIAGHRRLAAAAQAGLATVPVVVRAATSLGPQVLAMLTENGQRSDLTPVEEGDAYQLLLDLPSGALTVDEISSSVGRSKKSVQERLKVTKLPESAQQRILRGQLDLDHAARMASFASDKEAMARLDRAAEAGPIALERALDQEKSTRAHKAALKKFERELVKRCRDEGVPYIQPDDEWIAVDELLTPPALTQIAPSVTDPNSDDADINEGQWALDAAHAESGCPGRAVTLFAPISEFAVLAVCTADPCSLETSTSTSTSASTSTDAVSAAGDKAREKRIAERAEEEARERKLAALRRRLESTGVARRKFLGELVRSKDAEARARALAMERFRTLLAGKTEREAAGRRLLAQIVLPNVSDAKLADTAGLARLLQSALEKATVAQLLLYSSLSTYSWNDAGLDNPTNWQWDATVSPSHNWATILVEEWGWERFPEEQALVDARAAGKESIQAALDVADEFCGDDL